MKLKIILGVLIILFILALVAVLVVGARLGDIVKAAMETVGPKVTQTTLTVDKVDVSLLAGSAGLKNLVLGNPEGYKAIQSISIGSAAISLAPRSVLSDKIIIHSIQLKAAEITFEGNPLGANNLTKIMANAKAATGPEGAASSNAPAAASTSGKTAAKKLEVDDLLISGAVVHANLTGLINRQLTLPLPDIHLTGLGQGGDGITAADLTQKILSEITVQTIKTLAGYVTGLGQDAKGAAQDILNSALQNSTNAAGAGVDKLKKGLGNLFGK